MQILQSLKHLAIRHDLVPEQLVTSRLQQEHQRWEARGRTPPTSSLAKQAIVKDYAARFRLETLVETGTYYGAMISACTHSFRRIVSIELQNSFFLRARKKFSRFSHISILHGDSGTELAKTIAEIRCACLFWLDAHYSAGLPAKGSVETPIMKELALIFAHPVAGHVILVDDARCFNGSHDYPELSDLAEYASAQGLACEVKDDVIRLVAKDRIAKVPSSKIVQY